MITLLHQEHLTYCWLQITFTSKQTRVTCLDVLEEHADDRHHCKAAVRQLCVQFFCLLRRIRCCQDLESKVSCCSRSSSRLILGNLAEGHVCQDLSPSCGRGVQQKERTNTQQERRCEEPAAPSCGGHFRDCSQSVGHVCEFQSGRWAQVARELASDLLGSIKLYKLWQKKKR